MLPWKSQRGIEVRGSSSEIKFHSVACVGMDCAIAGRVISAGGLAHTR
jgi:hypothetical protein